MKLKNKPFFQSSVFPYFAVLLLISLITLVGEAVKRYLEPTNLAMFYLLAVVAIALKWGRGPAIWTSVLGVLAFDFFLVPPYFTLAVSQVQYLFTFVGLLTAGVLASELMVISRRYSKKSKQIELMRATEKLHTSILNSISHDFRTPLVSITGALSMLLHDTAWFDEEARKELLGNAFEQSERLNALVGNLLDVSRLEAGSLKVSSRLCDLRDLLGVSLEILNDKIQDRVIDIKISQDFPEIPADFSLFVKVLTNLIENALKYSPPEKPIIISAGIEADKVKIDIADEGIGIPPGDLKKIFHKFYRSQVSSETRGMGLGLSIVQGIVEAHGGEIWAENRSDKKGSRFIIRLPLKEDVHEK